MKTCLIVDDSRIIRKVARQIIESFGFGCSEAENGQAALEACAAAMPDIVLLDWNMPVMNGLDYIRAVRQMPASLAAKIIFCTVKNDGASIRQALDAGADEYIMKPFDVDIIRGRFEQLELLAEGAA